MAPDVEQPVIGLIGGDQPSDFGLARAATRQPGWSVRGISLDEPVTQTVAALAVDVPLAQRAAVLERLARRWRVPILIEAPVTLDLALGEMLAGLVLDDRVVVANPLRYALHTRRLLEDVTGANDPQRVQSFFAAWRFRAESNTEHALPQLLDYLGVLCPEPPCRISALGHPEQSIALVTLRYTSDVIGSIEVGGHLPASFPAGSELIVECFCETCAYACEPGRQAIDVYGRDQRAYSWQPDAAQMTAAAFAGWLRGGARPPGSIANDVTNLRLVDRISQALQTGAVLGSGVA